MKERRVLIDACSLAQPSRCITAAPAAAFAGIVDVSKWWENSHTYSGSAKNMSIAPKAGGCFCETIPPDGEVQHGVVVFVQPGKVLRLTGALGPMQSAGIAGALTFTLKPAGEGTEITLVYNAGGYMRGGIEAIAGPAGGMLGAQVASLKSYLDKKLR